MRRSSGTTNSAAVLVVKTADHLGVAALENLDDLALGPATSIRAGATDHHAVAVQHFLHLAWTERYVGPIVVGDQKAEAVGVPLDATAHEIELAGDTDVALAVQQQLSIALHRSQAPLKKRLFVGLDIEERGEMGRRHRSALLLQHLEDEFPARQRMTVAAGFPLQVGITMAKA